MRLFLLILFIAATAFLTYIYFGYLVLLKFVNLFGGRHAAEDGGTDAVVSITVLLTVLNEVEQIEAKLDDIFACDYPEGMIKALVASDGSTDGTDDAVAGYDDNRVLLFSSKIGAGKTATQNEAVKLVEDEIILFTDADTRFSKGFLRAMAAPFRADDVGAVDGHLQFLDDPSSGIAKSQGFYWNNELRIREYESRLGILAVGSGQCLAVRKELLEVMPETVGEDCIVPLQVVAQHRRIIHASGAIAYDRTESEAAGELKSRARMTLRNWQGTWSVADLLNPFSHPGIAFALWSHKILRWLSPIFMIVMMAAALALALYGSLIFIIVSCLIGAALSAAGLGWATEKRCARIPVISQLYSFLLANLGFLMGLWQASRGRSIAQYR